jgi:hypothetical protein
MAGVTWDVYRPSSGGPRRTIATGIELSGTEELTKALSVFGELAKEMLGKALYREAEYIMSDAKQLCPVDTGNLRASGHVTQPEVTGESVSVVLGFGGPAVKYALPVHERLDVHHPNGQAKYLEQPMLAAAKNLESRLASYMRGK